MLFFWILLFILVFLGTIVLIFYMTTQLNDIEREVNAMSESIRNDYATPPDTGKKNKKK